MDTYQPNRSPVEQRSPLRGESRYSGRDDPTDRPAMDSYRRRSPGASDRRSRGRGRSRSPIAIDRYLPDSRSGRDDHYTPTRDREDRRRASPPPSHIDRYVPGQDGGKPAVRVNPLPNPLTLDFQVGFNWFAEWWRVNEAIKEDRERQKNGGRRPVDRVKGERESREEREKEKGQIQAAYDNYKEELQVKLSRSFVQHHKGEEWFRERYLPEVRDPFRRRLTDFRRGNYSQWEQDLDSGVFDEFTLEGIYKSESNGQGGIVEKEEGETTAVAEVLQVGDLLPVKGGDVRDESAFQPALLIKTIAPTVSREKIEDFCKEHLGEQDGGFRWLSLSDPNPLKKCHRIGWVMLHPSSEQNVTVERGDGREEEMEEGEDNAAREERTTETNASPAEKALEAINGKTIHDEVRGDFTCHVGVHVPPNVPRKKALWDLFSAPERIERDLELASRLALKFDAEFESEVNTLSKIEEKVEEIRSRGLLTVPETGLLKASRPKKEVDLDADGDDEEGEAAEGESEEEEGTYDEDVDDEDLLFKKKKLDLLVEYLRRVFNFCFFCVFESDSIHELTRKCPGGHLRRPRASLSSAAKEAARASAYGLSFPFSRKDSITEGENGELLTEEKKFFKPGSKGEQQLQRAFNWVKTFEDKILQILEPENVDLKKIGGKPVEDAAQEELAKYVKQEDEAKFRCKIPECTKLFKADYFWRKHVEKRHVDWLETLKKDLTLVNAYCLDPARIGPGRPDVNSNGHFPTGGSHMPAGTPRGFSLANMPMNFGFGMPGGVPGTFPPFMAHHAIQAPGGWNGLPPDMAGADDRHLPGPMRRGGGGGGRYGARTGPYDRRQNPRDARWNPAGRLSPPRGGSGARPAGPGKWGEGSASAVGPREAVQGRSLKSYEDLDAVGASNSGDLNY